MAIVETMSTYINQKGIPLSEVAEGTGIPLQKLQSTLDHDKKRLSADEFLRICCFLNKDPYEFTGGIER